MRPLTLLLYIICIGVLFSEAAFAQLSPVFLQPQYSPTGKARRPNPRITPLGKKRVQKPQTVGTSHSDFPNINVSQWFFADQNETSIAVNPTYGKNIVIGANDYRSLNTLWYYASTDGGLTWKSEALPTDQALYYATDPSVAFGPDGVAFYGNGRIASGGEPYPINDVVCYKSTAMGQMWSAPARVVFDSTGAAGANKLADKYYLAVAPTAPGPLAPKVYVAWVEYENERSRIVAARSSDGGATWSAAVQISPLGKFQAPIPTVAVGGEVYVAFIDLDTTKREILFAKSTDGGATFGTPKKIANYNNLGPMYPTGAPNPHPIIKGHLRVNSFPSIAVDHSFKHFNRIYTTWAGKGVDGRHHIYLSKSDDFGSTWSEALPIETDKSAINTDKFFPWIAVDPTTGNVGICFYDSRQDPAANQLTDLYLGISEDGGESFSVQPISDVSFNPSVTSSTDSLLGSGDTLAFFGDYNGLAAHSGMWYPAWTDSREGYDQDVYIGIVNPRLPESVKDLEVNEEASTHFPVLSWEHSGLTTFGAPLGSYVFHIKRSDSASIDLPSTYRSFRDSSVMASTAYTYEVTAVASELSSVGQEVRFTPFAVRKPEVPIVIASQAESSPESGFLVRFQIPSKNVIGDTIRDLDYLYYLIDGITVDSFKLSDGLRGAQKERSFSAPTGYHELQLAVTTLTNGEVVSSDTSRPLWVYAGQPRDSYSESFQDTKDIFSIFSWDVTSVDLPSTFINDSLPNIAYPSGTNTWFLLPPARLSTAIHTLEFDHIALVAAGDSALVEVSFDNGVSYEIFRRYDKLNEPLKWNTTLATSIPSADSIPLKGHIGKDAIVRFRLAGANATNEDGWFIDNIRFTNKLAVGNTFTASMHSLILRSSIVTERNEISAELTLRESGYVTVVVTDILGRDVQTILERRYIPEGSYQIDFTAPQPGAYFIAATVTVPGKPVSVLRGRFIVLP
jgi:hypothetical protein